jgi:uncharacterized protein (TIGR03437 family)
VILSTRRHRSTSFLRLATALLFAAVVATTKLGGQTSSPSVGAVEFNASEASVLVEAINAELLGVMPFRRRAANLAQSPSAFESRIKQRANALKAVIQSDPARALALALPDAELQRLRTAFPDSVDQIEVRGRWVGQLEHLIADNQESGHSWEIHRLRTASGQLDAFFSERGQYELASGDVVEISGVRIDSVVAGTVIEVSRSASAGTECSPIGEQRTAVLLTTFPGMPLPQATLQDVHDVFFDTAGKSLDSYWRDASYGSTYATGDVFGWFTLDRDYTCNETGELREAAIRAADAQVDFRNYRRLFIIHPTSSQGCSVAGTGSVGCVDLASPQDGSFRASTSWLRARDTLEQGVNRGVGLIAHEGGHNLGLQHASALDFGSIPLGDSNSPGEHFEYGDLYSTMGLHTYSLGHYSARHKLQLGWLTNETEVKTVEAPGSFVIRPLGSKELGLKAIRVRRKPGEQDWLWVQYRQPIGPFETGLGYGEVYEGPQIHYENSQNADDADSSPHRGKTYLLDFQPDSDQEVYDFRDGVLLPGIEWQDPYSSQSIKVLSATADRLTVRIGPDSGCTISLSLQSRTHPSSSDLGSIAVSAPQGCAWDVVPSKSWIHITSGLSGTGPGTVSYSVDANLSTTARNGEISIGPEPFSITQDSLCRVYCSVTAPKVLATGDSAQFRGSVRVLDCSATPKFSWQFGDGGVSALQTVSHSYQSAGLYDWSLEASANGISCIRSGQVQINDPIESPAIHDEGIVLSTLLPKVSSISPGSIISVFGENFSNETILFPNLDADGKLETILGGVCLEMNGERLPIFAVTPGQINAQASTTAAPGPAMLRVITDCDTPNAVASQIQALSPAHEAIASNDQIVTVESATPGFFLFAPLADDGVIAARFNQGAVAVAPHGMFTDQFGTSRPAKPDEIILLYGTGWGQTTAALETGELATSAAEVLLEANPTVTFGGVLLDAKDVLYVGVTPQTAGLFQLAIRVPEDAEPGDNQVVLTVYGRSTPVGPVVPVEAP